MGVGAGVAIIGAIIGAGSAIDQRRQAKKSLKGQEEEIKKQNVIEQQELAKSQGEVDRRRTLAFGKGVGRQSLISAGSSGATSKAQVLGG